MASPKLLGDGPAVRPGAPVPRVFRRHPR